MRRAEVLKVTRSLTRLRHSLAADRDLNETLPRTLREFDEAVANGELLDASGAIDSVLGVSQ